MYSQYKDLYRLVIGNTWEYIGNTWEYWEYIGNTWEYVGIHVFPGIWEYMGILYGKGLFLTPYQVQYLFCLDFANFERRTLLCAVASS